MRRPEAKLTAKFVVLKGLENHGAHYGGECYFRFFTTNDPKEDPTKIIDGTVAYEILGYAETGDEARKVITSSYKL